MLLQEEVKYCNCWWPFVISGWVLNHTTQGVSIVRVPIPVCHLCLPRVPCSDRRWSLPTPLTLRHTIRLFYGSETFGPIVCFVSKNCLQDSTKLCWVIPHERTHPASPCGYRAGLARGPPNPGLTQGWELTEVSQKGLISR